LILGIQLLCLPGLAAAADCFNGPNASGVCTVPAGVTQVTIHAIGGGGGGGRDFNSAANGSGAGGGGGGSYCGGTFPIPGGTDLQILVGEGGPGALNVSGGSAGGISGVQWGGNAVVAAGGSGGEAATYGNGGSTGSCTLAGTTAYAGGRGGDDNDSQPFGGGGGGAAGSGGAGSNGGDVTTNASGAGGPGGPGSPAGGNGGIGGIEDQPGGDAVHPGGGGGGSGSWSIVPPNHGGAGAPGIVVLSFQLPTYTVSASVNGGNGSVSCDPTSVSAGGTSGCTAVPDPGYKVSGWTGACAPTGTNVHCTLNNIQENKTSTVSFEQLPGVHVSAAVVGGNGAVSCSPTTVNPGGSSACTAQPNPGYRVNAWTGACESAGSGTTCNLANIQEDKSSTVSFSAIDYSVSASVLFGSGSVSCSPTTVNYGGHSTCNALPAGGYQVGAWTGACQAAGTGTSAHCVLNDITANQTSAVIFVSTSTGGSNPGAGAGSRPSVPVPVMPLWGLGLLGLLLGAAAWFRSR